MHTLFVAKKLKFVTSILLFYFVAFSSAEAWAMMHRFFGKGRQKLQNFLPISCLVMHSA